MKLGSKRTRLIVAVVAAMALLGFGANLYIGPFLGKVRKARRQLRAKTEELREMEAKFAGYSDPEQKIEAMRREVEVLRASMSPYDKIKGQPILAKDLPEFLKNPVPEIELELYRDYAARELDKRIERIEDKFYQRNVDLPGGIFPDAYINKVSEVVPLLNQLIGLEGLLDLVLESDVIAVDSVQSSKAEKFKGSFVEQVPLRISLTLTAESLAMFMYNLAEADRFFYVKSVRIEPVEEYDDAFFGYQDQEQELRLDMALYASHVAEIEAGAGLVEKKIGVGREAILKDTRLLKLLGASRKKSDEK